MKKRLDAESPVPLYHQIAEAIRGAIESGEFAMGDSLAPLREAAEQWQVNVHTVRHAYASLVREGLIRTDRGRRGTRVIASKRRESRREFDLFVRRATEEAETRFGRSAADFASAVSALTTQPGQRRVYVVECSAWQCECHCGEIAGRYAVDARPWTLDHQSPPPGPMLATFFHYNDVRTRWPQLLNETHFVAIFPAPGVRRQLAGARRVVIHELDESTADAVASDLLATVGDVKIDKRIDDAPERIRIRGTSGPTHIFAPRVWAELTATARSHPRAVELRYVFDPTQLEAVARSLAWPEEVAV